MCKKTYLAWNYTGKKILSFQLWCRAFFTMDWTCPVAGDLISLVHITGGFYLPHMGYGLWYTCKWPLLFPLVDQSGSPSKICIINVNIKLTRKKIKTKYLKFGLVFTVVYWPGALRSLPKPKGGFPCSIHNLYSLWICLFQFFSLKCQTSKWYCIWLGAKGLESG